MIDIDFFKLYNDTYGHLAGDESLKKVASVLLKYAKRSSDFAFRLGGEEFCLIASSLNEQQSYELANHLRKDIEGLKIEHINNQASNFLTVSIGLIVKNNFEFSNVNSIYKEADDALYKAKDNGRNRIFPPLNLNKTHKFVIIVQFYNNH